MLYVFITENCSTLCGMCCVTEYLFLTISQKTVIVKVEIGGTDGKNSENKKCVPVCKTGLFVTACVYFLIVGVCCPLWKLQFVVLMKVISREQHHFRQSNATLLIPSSCFFPQVEIVMSSHWILSGDVTAVIKIGCYRNRIELSLTNFHW